MTVFEKDNIRGCNGIADRIKTFPSVSPLIYEASMVEICIRDLYMMRNRQLMADDNNSGASYLHTIGAEVVISQSL
jgi:hypothetical protein